MRKDYLVILLSVLSFDLFAQNTGLGTTTPAATFHVKKDPSSNSFSGVESTMILEDSGSTLLHISGNTGSSTDRTGIRFTDNPYDGYIHLYGPTQQLNIGVLGRNQLIVGNNGIIVHNLTNNPNGDNSAALQVVSSNKGVLLPRMTFTQRQAIISPASSLLIYQIDSDSGYYYNAAPSGGTSWQKLLTAKDMVFERADDISLVRNSSNYATDNFVFGRSALPSNGVTIDKLFFFHKALGAFRTGMIDNNTWALVNLGQASFGSGYNTRASGSMSTAMGNETSASGSISTAIGDGTQALGYGTLASGITSIARGEGSTSMGMSTETLGKYSVAAGIGTRSKPFASFVVGQYNDTTTAAGGKDSWIDTDPVFIVGNGVTSSNRANALTILKNGSTGINVTSPEAALHIRNVASGAPHILLQPYLDITNTASIRYENRHVIFQTTETSDAFWDFRDNNGVTKLMMTSNGDLDIKGNLTLGPLRSLGVNTTSPQAPIHVIKNGASAGMYNARANVIIEDNDHAYLQFSHPNIKEAGVLSGNTNTPIRSGIIFASDSSIHFRSGGNNGRMFITSLGNVGIGTGTPAAKLDIAGTFKFGSSGSVLASVIKLTVNKDVPSISAGNTSAVTFSVPGAVAGATVMISPSALLDNGIVIGSARVLSTDIVEVRFINTTAAVINVLPMDYYIVVVQ